ncbi:MAG TPA: glycoside hydrolase family 18 protein [Cyclobacteriaceae bacterium]|nr:glycoside hydrolase family 18 protein [Cyclobacteriaceae bacterium]
MKQFLQIRFLILVVLFFTTRTVFAQAQNKIKVLSYYSGPVDSLDKYDVSQMTHIIFCFGRLNGNQFGIRNARDTTMIQKMVSLKSKNPDLKVLISLGGWGGCKTCSDVFATKVGREEFTQSIREIYEYFKVDGLDLDWEYPGISGFPGHKFDPADKKNFTKLVNELRKLGYEKELSFAAGASQRYLDGAVEWKKVMKQVNYVNLMTYDMSGPGSKTAMHHTGLFSTPEQPRSADWMVNALTEMGVPAEKIVIGGAFYGKVFDSVENINNGLGQAAKFKTTFQFKRMETMFPADSGWVYHWDEAASAPYLYNAEKKQFCTFDDKRSIAEKARYAVDKNLYGIMYWQLGGDKYSDGLLNEIDKVKRTYVSGSK